MASIIWTGHGQLGTKGVDTEGPCAAVEWNADLSRLERYWLSDVPDMSVVSVETKSCQDGISIIGVSVLPNAKMVRRDDGPRIIQVSTPVANNYRRLAFFIGVVESEGGTHHGEYYQTVVNAKAPSSYSKYCAKDNGEKTYGKKDADENDDAPASPDAVREL